MCSTIARDCTGAGSRLAARPGRGGDDPDARLGAAAAGAARGDVLRHAAVDRRAGGARVHLRRRFLHGADAGARGGRRAGWSLRAGAADAAPDLRSAPRRDAGQLDVVSHLPPAALDPARGYPPLHRALAAHRAAGAAAAGPAAPRAALGFAGAGRAGLRRVAAGRARAAASGTLPQRRDRLEIDLPAAALVGLPLSRRGGGREPRAARDGTLARAARSAGRRVVDGDALGLVALPTAQLLGHRPGQPRASLDAGVPGGAGAAGGRAALRRRVAHLVAGALHRGLRHLVAGGVLPPRDAALLSALRGFLVRPLLARPLLLAAVLGTFRAAPGPHLCAHPARRQGVSARRRAAQCSVNARANRPARG